MEDNDVRPQGELLVYQGQGLNDPIQVRLEGDTVWLSQKLLAELYGVVVPTINEHISNIYDEEELAPEATIRKFRIVQTEGNRQVGRLVDHYNLDMILAVGFRVRSRRGSQLRKWASDRSIEVNIAIMRAFVTMRRFLAANSGLLQRVDSLERRQISHEIKTDDRFDKVFDALESKNLNPAQGIFFNGQIFDAYVFINDLLRQAKRSIVLIDNYIDNNVLVQLAKRRKGVSTLSAVIARSRQATQRSKRKVSASPPSSVIASEAKQSPFADSHDRFLILDGGTVYHLGASLKDLGKKWFAFSKMDKSGLKVMEGVDALMGTNLKEIGYGG